MPTYVHVQVQCIVLGYAVCTDSCWTCCFSTCMQDKVQAKLSPSPGKKIKSSKKSKTSVRWLGEAVKETTRKTYYNGALINGTEVSVLKAPSTQVKLLCSYFLSGNTCKYCT